MLRKFLNIVLDATASIPMQAECAIYTSPFTRKETSQFAWLSSQAPCFPVRAENITILTEPQQFYDTLIEKCRGAKERVTLSSLYVGTGQLEQNLVQALMDNDNFQNGTAKINILLDYTRGSRYKNNSRVILKPLLQRNDQNCHISLYHTPILRGLKKKWVPDRWNELFGLQHMKLYIFDDTLLISGANLSNDYFTNRQDRYYMIKDRDLTDFYNGLVRQVQRFSLYLDKEDEVHIRCSWSQLPYQGNLNDFVVNAGNLVESYITQCINEQNICKREGYDTWVFPLVQMGQLGINQDACVTKRLLAEAPSGASLCIATGYFNLTWDYMDTLVTKCFANCKLLMAHPNANGFQGASFPAGGIPDAYSLIAQRFKNMFEGLGQSERFSMHEYFREGWTYHGKGLWYYAPEQDLPNLTLIGSPNFGERSVRRDLETQLAIVTENGGLRQKMDEECKQLYKLGLPANVDRVIPKWVYPMVYFFRGFF
ncbi:hypothetical protein PPYR_13193 [Photinus pyralis]|uniref:CDP-diacylglycerol--glycerol-3-phosphate 3-phosphatidyltransferase n=2 Tax=Photinus pyralis TaxID=7054 RepID=A0A5N4A8C8_PHOPY|nr:CDP-diacylglycerol--glycerol-3-phosphate 3-phosphatidyltransferase, mitochondrial isoform X1 [Photinus pyralis]KAB0793573.1 hypothetical protein PPYR_13193 [Photinus pyralis]